MGLLKSDRNPPLRLRVFHPEVVVHGMVEIALSRLNRRMPEQKLNLLKLTSSQMT